MPGVDPYLVAGQSRRGGYPSSTGFGGYGGAYGGGGMGGGSRYGRTRLPILPDLSSQPSAVPQGGGNSEMGTSGQAQAVIAEQRAKEEAQSREVGQNINAASKQFSDDQQASVNAYRTAQANSQGAQDSRNQTQESRSLGIDPSSSLPDIAAAASGKTNLANNTGAGTSAAVAPNETDVRNAVTAQQNAKDGSQLATEASAYATGAGSVPPPTQTGTGTNPFTSGISPKATPTSMTSQPLPPAGATAPASTVAQATQRPQVQTTSMAYSPAARTPRQPVSVSPINVHLR